MADGPAFFMDGILWAIAILAFCTLISRNPSQSALFLFLESILLALYLAMSYGINSAAFGTSILLCFFSMVAIGCNYYFETSFKRPEARQARFNIALGGIMLIMFLRYIGEWPLADVEQKKIDHLIITHDAFGLAIAGFSLFAILVSALTIFDIKNPKPGDGR